MAKKHKKKVYALFGIGGSLLVFKIMSILILEDMFMMWLGSVDALSWVWKILISVFTAILIYTLEGHKLFTHFSLTQKYAIGTTIIIIGGAVIIYGKEINLILILKAVFLLIFSWIVWFLLGFKKGRFGK